MKLKTHLAINETLCGRLVSLDEGKAVVKFTAAPEMVADVHGLVHGGFIFGAADYAAMAAVNDPNVVLGAAEVKFLKPSRSGDATILTATVTEVNGKQRRVEVEGLDEAGTRVFTGLFTCFVLAKHVLNK
ncbi:MAG: PaaI family thioesterase [Syntrophaceae bacterium]|nr:PaaI family thioesterase [Syntrophaceae bacterium]